MRADIHRAALRAAAKLAFSATVLGCGGATATEPSPTADDKTPADTSSTDGGRVAHDSGRHEDAATMVCGPAVTAYQTREECCTWVVQEAYPDGSPDLSFNPAPNVSADVRECCQVLAHAADERIADGGDGWRWKDRGMCCAVIGFEAAATCTPWGPAVPPAMLWRNPAVA